jgi:hypothetical protein
LGLSAIAIVAQVAILSILRARKLRSSFPVFFGYLAFSTVLMVLGDAIYVARIFPDKYFYLYWTFNFVQMLLQFAVMYEVFVNALKPYSALIDLGKMLFRWAALFLVMAAAFTASSSGDTRIARCLAAAEQFERGILLVQCGLLFLFFLFERRLGLSWRSHSVSIGIGLGVLSTFTLCFSYLRDHFAAQISTINMLDNFSSTAIVIFWAVCLYLPEPQKRNVLDSPAKLIFQRWNEALVATPFAAHAGGGAAAGFAQIDSFLPNVERTVERVLARKIAN